MFADDERPKRTPRHEVGQDLTLLSVAEIDERIALLRDEIARLEADREKKNASKAAAASFFKS